MSRPTNLLKLDNRHSVMRRAPGRLSNNYHEKFDTKNDQLTPEIQHLSIEKWSIPNDLIHA